MAGHKKYHAPAAAPDNDSDIVATPINTIPSFESQPYLKIVAPATLPEGYTFNAEANGQSFRVKVPEGGVEKGQTFGVPFPAGADGYLGSTIPRVSVPVGEWKDGLCDCCQHGVFHPVFWNAWCCRLILTGQVMQRLNLTWLGNEGTYRTTSAFRILFLVTAANLCIDELLNYLADALTDEDDYDEHGYPASDIAKAFVFGRVALVVSFTLFTMFVVARTRARVRAKYRIYEQYFIGCEDCCCSVWCNCCTVAQMARHTADYDTYAAVCCSETGMPLHAPSIV
eukprot:CAMPEP_0172560778 /NCGR_PEP_ID=MMETSP1067-20121228/90157_1 /TAXON_ID=265564 ORGANISM="Thalassiosira punctigera, Strain Tpunct2005C2" /NCGR_SAMPLE_ID=MMETSP1067 /ASSEMBLY_ACC=CAM_ASM_000444 /LENGTH=282 /DNA_ID=CAMNT_0013350649 /DNA_START=203 /DNA_END=1051 /DNA_ORIENTATION=-